MVYFWLDASAAVKNYITEEGTPEMQHFFTHVPAEQMIFLYESVGEIISVFVGRRNLGKRNPKSPRGITEEHFNQIKQQFDAAVTYCPEVKKVHANESQKDAALHFLEKHSLNNTDTQILRCALDKANQLRIAGDNLIFISSDTSLLNAARREGLPTFNPETGSKRALDALINPP